MESVTQLMSDKTQGEQALGALGRIPGILDEQTLTHLLDVELARARRYEHPFSLLRVRSSQYSMLVETAGALRMHTRWADSIGIVDGTALLVILRDTSLAGAQTAAVKILAALSEELSAPMMSALMLDSAAWRKGDDRARLLARLSKA
ncbi:MAG: hypothetical protein ACI8W7_005001 [Gammaproteobacteria bacterium]|jgi:hypothetical protein